MLNEKKKKKKKQSDKQWRHVDLHLKCLAKNNHVNNRWRYHCFWKITLCEHFFFQRANTTNKASPFLSLQVEWFWYQFILHWMTQSKWDFNELLLSVCILPWSCQVINSWCGFYFTNWTWLRFKLLIYLAAFEYIRISEKSVNQ